MMSQKEVIKMLCAHLKYDGQCGYIDLNSLDNLSQLGNKRFMLSQAKSSMSVVSVFGVWGQSNTSINSDAKHISFTPLVYIALANTIDEVQQIHRKVWSQGGTPFLLVVLNDIVFLCDGFEYNSITWKEDINKIDINDEFQLQFLNHLCSYKLRSSIVWRDYAIDTRNRIDTKLLNNLEALNRLYSEGILGCSKLDTEIANKLIGKFLYLCTLYDRNILSDSWIIKYAPTVDLHDQNKRWLTKDVWALFDKIDDLFNGSIFPLTSTQRRQIKVEHINFLRQIMRHGGSVSSTGIQLSFIDIHFASLQTETLSAVYEKFLETEDDEKQRKDGAFYTPPFLVDYIVDKADQINDIREGKTVFDPSCGSGAFLVASLRRIIEKDLYIKNNTTLSPVRLRKLVTNNIFATEKNLSACQVAAFSCYITLLDYLCEKDIKKVVSGDETSPLFPQLVGTNIIHTDFFDNENLNSIPTSFDFILGNPPWQKISDISPVKGVEVLENTPSFHVDQREAAELFAWKSAEKLKQSGLLALLMPTKSFISPSAKTFAINYCNRHDVIGIANFSHLRYRLFSSARQPATAIFCSLKKELNQIPTTWVYSPSLDNLPISKNGKPWIIIENQAEIRTYRSDEIFKSCESLFEKILLKPIDQKILQSCNDKIQSGRLNNFEDFLENCNLKISRGGSPNQTKISENKLLGGDKNRENYFKYQLRLGDEDREIDNKKTYRLTKKDIKDISENFRRRFSGNIVLIPRSMNAAFFIESPIAYNSSLNAIYSKDKKPDKYTIKALKAIEKYLNSNFVRYLFALYGRLWIIDRTRLEVNDLKKIPIPIKDIYDKRINIILNSKSDELDEKLIDLFQFDQLMSDSIREYSRFRYGYEDAQLPQTAFNYPSNFDIERYLSAFKERLQVYVSEENKFNISILQDNEHSSGILRIYYSDMPHVTNQKDTGYQEAIDRYNETGGSIFNNSAFIHYDENTLAAHLIKPLEKSAWTIEKAFDESQKIISRYMEF